MEVASALRRLLLLDAVTEPRVEEALGLYLSMPLRRYRHEPLLGRIVALRSNFSAYDATYVALAELLGVGLLTADDRLATSVRLHLNIEVPPL